MSTILPSSQNLQDDASNPFQPSQSSRIVQVPHDYSQNNHPGIVISKIEDIFESMIDTLTQDGDFLSIPYRSRTASPDQPIGVLKFPGRTVNEATKFTRMMRIMELSREALVSGRLLTKRNIYYQNPDLFKKQSVVDRLVDDLAFTLGVSRNALNIVAASKGLLAGPIKLLRANGSVLSYSSDSDNNDLIPPIGLIHQIDFADTRWIIVIEKEATFRTLAASLYWTNCIHGPGIILTGKGYPDLATLEFLTLVHTMRPLLPVLCVVDCDPHGIEIMRMFKYGSKGFSHENARVPGLQWLGVKMDDILGSSTLMVDEHSLENPTSQSSQSSGEYFSQESASHFNGRSRTQQNATSSLIALTTTDRKTAQRILKKIVGKESGELDHEDSEQMKELQTMLMLNMKAEIQAIDNMGDLSSWLDSKIGMV